MSSELLFLLIFLFTLNGSFLERKKEQKANSSITQFLYCFQDLAICDGMLENILKILHLKEGEKGKEKQKTKKKGKEKVERLNHQSSTWRERRSGERRNAGRRKTWGRRRTWGHHNGELRKTWWGKKERGISWRRRGFQQGKRPHLRR